MFEAFHEKVFVGKYTQNMFLPFSPAQLLKKFLFLLFTEKENFDD